MSDLHTNGNGNGSWFRKSTGKGAQMFIADIVGNVTELLFLRYQEAFDKTIPVLKSGFKTAMYTPVKCIQQPLEWAIDKFAGSIEGEAGREARHHQTQEQRLDGLLDAGYHYSSALAVGWGSLVMAEKGLSKMMGTKALPGRMWTRVDLPVHLGMMWFLGSHMMKPATTSMKDLTKKLMVASGWNEDKAEQDSRFFMAYIVPNYLTLVPTVGMMGTMYKAESKGLVKDVGAKDWFGEPEHHFQMTGKQAQPGDLSAPGKMVLEVAKKLGVIDSPGASRIA